jgi:amidase
MAKLGATVIDVTVPDLIRLLEGSSVIDFEFKADLAEYLAGVPTAPIHTLGEILDRGLYHSALERTFRRRNAAPDRDSPEYRNAMARRDDLRAGVLRLMDAERLDALVYPSMKRKPAPIGETQRGSNCLLSASTGFPALSLPAGFTEDVLPVGVELLGRPWSDARLLALGYAYEQVARHRMPPPRVPALVRGRQPEPLSWEVAASGNEAVPSSTGKGKARALFSFDGLAQMLRYSIEVSDVEEHEVLFAGIRRAPKGKNGPVVFTLSSRPLRKLSGTLELSAALRRDLVDGQLYLCVSAGAGLQRELRAQLILPNSGDRRLNPRIQ